MADKKGFGERWEEYSPSKTMVFWSWVAVSVLTIVAGFSWGGWTTNGTALEMVGEARRDLAATFCVERFLAASDAGAQHDLLMKASDWQRDDFVEKGGWADLSQLDKPIAGVASLCAEKLADVKISASTAQSTTETPGETTVQ